MVLNPAFFGNKTITTQNVIKLSMKSKSAVYPDGKAELR